MEGVGMETENPLESLVQCAAFWVGDWAEDKRLAWMYGIICGWDDDDDDDDGVFAELQTKHGWTPEAIERLKRLHAKFEELLTK